MYVYVCVHVRMSHMVFTYSFLYLHAMIALRVMLKQLCKY